MMSTAYQEPESSRLGDVPSAAARQDGAIGARKKGWSPPGGLSALVVAALDLYAYLHDQTLRLINQGYIHSEIAEMIELPPELDRAWHAAATTDR